MSVEELVVKYFAWVISKARTFYDDEADAEDLAGETAYKCLNSARRFDNAKDFKPWALTIMRNTFITQYNRRACVQFERFPDYETRYSEDYADSRASVNRILSIIRDCGQKSCCIESVMLYARGYSYDEIGRRLGIGTGTVKSRVSAGRRLLYEALS